MRHPSNAPGRRRCRARRGFEDVALSRLVESRIAEETGPYLPLKTWADAPYHFDPEQIRKKAPMRMHPILGETYQVKIVTTGDKLQRDMVREQVAKMTSDRGAASSAMAAQGNDSGSDEEKPSKVKANKEAATSSEASDSSASSATSDDESSDSGKKRKGSKKTKGRKSKKKSHKKKSASKQVMKAKEAERAKQAAHKKKEQQKLAAAAAAKAEKEETTRVRHIQTDCSKAHRKNDFRHDAVRQFAEGQTVLEGACHHLEENSGCILGLACPRVRSVFEVEGQVPPST